MVNFIEGEDRAELARRQAELVAALVAGGPVPPGFDESDLRVTATALLRKRAGQVAAEWPELSRSFGRQWHAAFARWASGGAGPAAGRATGSAASRAASSAARRAASSAARRAASSAASGAGGANPSGANPSGAAGLPVGGARPAGAVRDGWDLARHLAAAGALSPASTVELAAREAAWRYDGRSAPRRRRWPAVRRADRAIVVQLLGRVKVWRRPD